MAWVRTATSLISFGFTIYKIFQQLADSTPAAEPPSARAARVALVLMALGVGGLIVADVDYRRQTKALQTRFHQLRAVHAFARPGVATIISGLGIIGFVLVFLRQ